MELSPGVHVEMSPADFNDEKTDVCVSMFVCVIASVK
jgi:hypothetical protein